MTKRFFNPFIVVSLYAFCPLISILGLLLSPGDVYLLLCIPLLLFKVPTYTLGRELQALKYFLAFVVLGSASFLLSSFFYLNVQYYWFPIILRPTLFCFFLNLYFTRLGLPSRFSFSIYLWFSTAAIFLFSFQLLINQGFSFSADQIWSYSPTTRLVGFRGVVLGRSFDDFQGNDSVNFSLFVCLIATYQLAVYRSNLLKTRFLNLASSITLFCLSSLSLSKSSYVFTFTLLLILLLSGLRTLLVRFTVRRPYLVLLFMISLLLPLVPFDIIFVLLPRLGNQSLSDIFTDSSSQARLSMIQPFIQDLLNNPFLYITGRGTGMLASAYNAPHFEGLFITTFAESGILLSLFLFFAIYNIFHPPIYNKPTVYHLFLRLSFFPFVIVSLFSSLTLYSSLLYPLLFTSTLFAICPATPLSSSSSSTNIYPAMPS